MNEKIQGAEALVRSLIAEGVDTVFGYPGGAIMPVYDKLFDFTGELTHYLTRHEQGAVHAAQGYARVSGRTGVVIVTSGPGASNVITGIADALVDSTPLVVITGQVGSRHLGTDAFQETDVVGITQPLTKWAFQIRHASEIAGAVAKAFHIANTGRPGPVVLDITKDAQLEAIEGFSYSRCGFIRSYDPFPRVDDGALRRVAAMINNAERPLILAGHGVMISGGERELAALAEKADIPVAATLLGLSVMNSDDPHFVGMLGMHGNLGPNVNTARADLIIGIGMRFDDRVTSANDDYGSQARIVHIDIDSSEFNKLVHADATIHGDAREVMARLLPLLRVSNHRQWVESFRTHNEAEKLVNAAALDLTDGDALPTMPLTVKMVSDASPADSILVTDVGQNQMTSARYFSYRHPRSIITSGGLGTMGFGIPAAIGARIGAPTRTVCLFTGDGGFQMTEQELGTIMQYGVAVKIVILNNNFLGNVRQWQQLYFNGRFSQTPMVNPDFIRLASAYGIEGENVTRRADLADAVARMLASDSTYILNVAIEPSDMVFPMINPGDPVDRIMTAPGCFYQPQS